MWELDYKERWALKNWCFWTVVLEKTLESPLDCKEIQPVHPKGDQSWVFIGRTDVEAETPILWPPDAKSWLIRKDPDAGKDWRQEEKGMTEDEMAGWHHWLNGHEFGWTPGVGDGQGGLACCGPWGLKESDVTEQLNWLTEHLLRFVHLTVGVSHFNKKLISQFSLISRQTGNVLLSGIKSVNSIMKMLYIFLFWWESQVFIKTPVIKDTNYSDFYFPQLQKNQFWFFKLLSLVISMKGLHFQPSRHLLELHSQHQVVVGEL